jgi:hypothetical protein
MTDKTELDALMAAGPGGQRLADMGLRLYSVKNEFVAFKQDVDAQAGKSPAQMTDEEIADYLSGDTLDPGEALNDYWVARVALARKAYAGITAALDGLQSGATDMPSNNVQEPE